MTDRSTSENLRRFIAVLLTDHHTYGELEKIARKAKDPFDHHDVDYYLKATASGVEKILCLFPDYTTVCEDARVKEVLDELKGRIKSLEDKNKTLMDKLRDMTRITDVNDLRKCHRWLGNSIEAIDMVLEERLKTKDDSSPSNG